MAKAKIYLYKEGNECVSLTGGWDSQKTSTTFTSSFDKKDNYMTYSATLISADSRFSIYPRNGINTSIYSCIVADTKNNTGSANFSIYKNTNNFGVTSNRELVTSLNKSGESLISLLNIITNPFYACITSVLNSSNKSSTVNVYNVYLETKENILTINSQEDDDVTFSVNDLGLVTISKIDVLVNGIVSKTYTDEYSNLSYIVDKSLCYIGNNNIEIRVTYSQGDDITEIVSEYLTYKYDVSQLPLETPLLDTVERVKLLTKSKQNEKSILSKILTSKNVEVSEQDKMSDLIGKVDLLGEYDDGKLWLYKDGEGVSNISKTNVTGVTPPTVNIQTNCIYISSNVSNSDRHISINTSNKIDLTKYSKFNVEYSCNIKAHNNGYNKFGLGAIEQLSFSDTNAWRNNSVVNLEIAPMESDLVVEKNIATLDIGNVNNSYFIFVYYGMYNGSNNATIHKIWLEK